MDRVLLGVLGNPNRVSGLPSLAPHLGGTKSSDKNNIIEFGDQDGVQKFGYSSLCLDYSPILVSKDEPRLIPEQLIHSSPSR